MSADNWGVCPKCNEAWERETERLERALEDAYGKVLPEEYIRLSAAFNQRGPLEQEKDGYQLREDYEIGVDEGGEFSIRYHGECQKCGFKFSYQYEQTVYPHQI